MTVTAIGKIDSYNTLLVAILGGYSVEQAIDKYETGEIGHVYVQEDTIDMIKLKDAGFSYSKIGEIYNLHPTSIHHRIKRHKKRAAATAQTN